jgi:four helix bundle protein
LESSYCDVERRSRRIIEQFAARDLNQNLFARIGVVAEEADECVLWLELLTESGIVKPEMTADLLKEAHELAAIVTASQQTAKRSVV